MAEASRRVRKTRGEMFGRPGFWVEAYNYNKKKRVAILQLRVFCSWAEEANRMATRLQKATIEPELKTGKRG